MRDNYLMDRELVDALWSPLEPARGRRGAQQAPPHSPPTASKTIIIDMVTRNSELDDAIATAEERTSGGQQIPRQETMSGKRHRSVARIMQNFARGMASAFGTHITIRPRRAGRKTGLNDFELRDFRAPRSSRHGVLPSGPRIRHFFSRMGGESVPLTPEQRPLAPKHHDSPSPYYPVMQNGFRLRH